VHALMLALERLPAYGPAWRGLMGRILRLGGPVPDVVFADDDLARLSCPVQYLWGPRDPFGDAAFGRRVAERTPGCRFDEVGTGHLPWLDAPDACARRIDEADGASRRQV